MQNLSKLTDDLLVKAYAGGDNIAFDVLLNRYRTKLFTYINNVVKNDDIADDIFQETFVKVITTIRQNRYSEDGKFASWLMRIAHNLIIDHFRQEKSENTVTTDNEDYDLLNCADFSDISIEEVMIDAMCRRETRCCRCCGCSPSRREPAAQPPTVRCMYSYILKSLLHCFFLPRVKSPQ